MKSTQSIPFVLKAAIKDVDGKKGIVTGYFANFNNVDGDGDIILPGAFTKSIRENGPASGNPRIKHLLNHYSSQPLGEIMVLQEDGKGLYYESQIGTHALGVDFVKMVESNLITEHSIGYETVKWRSHDSLTYEMWGKEYPVRELVELKLWEGSSLTAWGANERTPLTGLKEYAVTRIPNLKAAIKNGTFTDATFNLLISEIELMEKALSQTTEPPKDTQPDEKKAIDAINNFLTWQRIEKFIAA